MVLLDNLPFYNINDDDLICLLSDSPNPVISLDILETLKYNNFTCDNDVEFSNDDPDLFIENSLGMTDPLCNYVFPGAANCNSHIHSNAKEHQVSILSHNIRSAPEHLETLLAECIVHNGEAFDIIGLCETRLSNDIQHLFEIPQYNAYFNNRSRKSGGVSLYVHERLNSVLRTDLTYSENAIESVFAEIKTPTKNVLVGEIYRRPKSNIHSFMEKLSDILTTACSENKLCILAGDFNLDLLTCSTTMQEFVGLLNSKLFFCVTTKPTRVTATSATILDHIWTNEINRSKTNGIIYSDITDHFPIFSYISLNNNLKSSETKVIEYREFSPANIDKLREQLSQVSWDLVYSALNPEVAYENFETIISASFNKFLPLKSKIIKNKHINKPYINRELKNLINYKNKVQRKYAKWPLTYGEEYKRLRNLVTRRLREAKSRYFSEKLEENASSKSQWKVINTILNRGKQSQKITLKVNSIEVTDATEVANHFNEYFSAVGLELARSVEPCSHNFLEFLGDRIITNFTIEQITEAELINIIKKLKNSSPGKDDISMTIIKHILPEIILPLLHIINCSLVSGLFPNKLKVAKVIPIPKSGDKHLLKNYRPVSILPAISKILEKIICTKLLQHLADSNIITPCQFGFVNSKSTDIAVTTFTNDVYRAFDNREFVLSLFLDLSKAFDTIDHNILLSKLEHYGIRNTSLSLFKSYLSNRMQYVLCNKKASSMQSITYGVPQGSILGPVLFLLYINDIVSTSSFFKFILYADDSNIYASGPSLHHLITMANEELKKILKWLLSNKLTLNTEKSHFLIFNRNKVIPNDLPQLKIGPYVIKRETSTKFLGLHIDEKLTWKDHINKIQANINKECAILYHTRHMLTVKAMKSIYYSLIYPHLTYCIVVWGGAHTTSLQPLVKAQKRVIRTMAGLSRYASTINAFNELNILKINEIERYFTSLFVFKSIFSHTTNFFSYRVNQRYAFRNCNILHIPLMQSSQSQSCILYRGPKIWNNLPEHVRNSITIVSFKKLLKSYIMSSR